MEAGETEDETALRELFEETGLSAQLNIDRTAAISYPISNIAQKQVVFFLGKVTGDPVVREGEIDRYMWVLEDELKDYLFPDTVDACKKLLS